MKNVILFSNGDFRDAVGIMCWPKQEETLKRVEEAFNKLGVAAIRGNPYKKEKQHGFINTQSEGCRVFSKIDPDSPIVVVLSSWVWAHHLASSLKLHRGPIVLLANFDGTWPGLVALLNHSATFERLGIEHSKLWTDAFTNDLPFMKNLQTWANTGNVTYSEDHISSLNDLNLSESAKNLGQKIAQTILQKKRILGQMDPGCMGMLNAVVSPDKLAAIGMPLELLSQSDLLAEMELVSDTEAQVVLEWLQEKKVHFNWGKIEQTDLTKNQVLEQMKMYLAAGKIYNRYGLSAIGIPYQYGLVRCTAASDLAEGMLNNSERPDIADPLSGQPIKKGRPIIHFNEGDIGSGVPQVLMHDILVNKDLAPETTLHDVRWGDEWEGKYVWVLEISGGAPPAHFGGWERTTVYRQTPMYFPKGGGTCSGVSRPGTVTWARFYESFGEIGIDIGTGEVTELPEDELIRRRELTSPEWPIANLYIPGYGRDQLMSTHKSNHITICYGNIAQELASTAEKIGIPANIIGDARHEFS